MLHIKKHGGMDMMLEYLIHFIRRMKHYKVLMLIMTAYLTVSSVLICTERTEIIILSNKDCVRPHNYWTTTHIKNFTRFEMITQYKWNAKEYTALNKLWYKESRWNPRAYNPVTSRGLHAQGIPQLLGMNRNLPAPQQVARGLAYISKRYGKPSVAWNHERHYGWY